MCGFDGVGFMCGETVNVHVLYIIYIWRELVCLETVSMSCLLPV